MHLTEIMTKMYTCMKLLFCHLREGADQEINKWGIWSKTVGPCGNVLK